MIIVQNDTEKELLKKWIDHMRDTGLDVLESDDHDYSAEHDCDQALQSDEWQVISNSLCGWCNIEVNPNEPEMEFDDTECVTGKCVVCGEWTTGTEDDRLTYSDYLHYLSDEQQKKWLCEDCYRKGDADKIED